MIEIHCWGDGENIACFDIESNLLNLLIQKFKLESKYKIIPDSNIFSSHSGILPYLQKENNLQINGFLNIWNFLQIDSNLSFDLTSIKDKIIFDSYLNNLINLFNLITNYNFFVIKLNYEEFTRGYFQKLLPWPTQYRPPIDIRNHSIELCINEGLIDNEIYHSSDIDNDDELLELRKNEKNLRETQILNEFQKIQIDKELDLINQKKLVISNMNCLKIVNEILKNFEAMKKLLNNEKINNFINLLILNFLKINIIDELKSNFILFWLKANHPELLKEIQNFSNLSETNSIQYVNKLNLKQAISSYISEII